MLWWNPQTYGLHREGETVSTMIDWPRQLCATLSGSCSKQGPALVPN